MKNKKIFLVAVFFLIVIILGSLFARDLKRKGIMFSDTEIEENENKTLADNPATDLKSFEADTTIKNVVFKPTGVFSSSGAFNEAIYENPELKGVLVRVEWKDIEPSPGQFNFSLLKAQINAIKKHGKLWSLAVLGGPFSPKWLIDDYAFNTDYVTYNWRGSENRLPLAWNEIPKERVKILAEKLAEEFGDDPNLALVYVTQFTQNGIEGQLPFNNMLTNSSWEQKGWTEDVWVNAVTEIAGYFSNAFKNKAIAVEVHEVLENKNVPIRIMNTLWNDPSFEKRAGVAVWWLSGKTTYQHDLINALKNYDGDIYVQLIGNSNQKDRFLNGDFSESFKQAKNIGARYIEPWEIEFTKDKWNSIFNDFNNYSHGL